MSTWLGPLLSLLSLIADQVRRFQRRKQREERDRERLEMQDDPVEFGRTHFNRMRDTAELPSVTGETIDPNSEELGDKQPGRREP